MAFILDMARSIMQMIFSAQDAVPDDKDIMSADEVDTEWDVSQVDSRWLASDLTDDITQVPLVGDKTRTVLAKVNITTTF
jgi:hypothetical protein